MHEAAMAEALTAEGVADSGLRDARAAVRAADQARKNADKRAVSHAQVQSCVGIVACISMVPPLLQGLPQ